MNEQKEAEVIVIDKSNATTATGKEFWKIRVQLQGEPDTIEMSAWSKTLADQLEPNTEDPLKTYKIRYEIKKTGSWTNYVIKQIADGNGVFGAPASPMRNAGRGKSDAEIKSIENQVALKEATNLAVAGKITVGEIQAKAQELTTWLTTMRELGK